MRVPPVHFLLQFSDRVDELRGSLQVRNLQPVFKYTADAAFCARAAAQRGGAEARRGGGAAGRPQTQPFSMTMQN